MISIPSLLVAASAILALLLGIIHLVYTFHGTKLLIYGATAILNAFQHSR